MKSHVHRKIGPFGNQSAPLDERHGRYDTEYNSHTRAAHLLVAGFTTILCWSSLSICRADPLDFWHPRASGVTNILNSAAYGNGTWVVVGNEGRLLTSADGVSWKKANSATTQALNSVIFANNLFVIVGQSGWILTSANGTTWTHRTSGTTDFLYDVTYGGGKFVAVSDTGTTVTSLNGLSWTARNGGTSGVYGIAFGNGKFVAVGGTPDPLFFFYDTVTYASADAQSWTQVYPGQLSLMSDLWFGNGTFVAVGDGGTILSSKDGSAWTQQNSSASEFLWNVTFGADTFVVVGGQQGGIYTSSDGVSWAARNSGNVNGLYNIAYGNGTFIAIGASGTILQSDSVLPPNLLLSTSGKNLVFSWLASAGNFALEETDNLTSPGWSLNTNQTPVTVGNQTTVTFSGSQQVGTKFYRLAKQP
jgi:hypothetical protein